MGAYRKLHFRKKFIECLLINAVDISSCIHSNHYMVLVGPLGCLAIGNLRCFCCDPLVASIWLTSLNTFTLGGFGCLTPFSLMWVSSSSWGGVWTRLALCLVLFLDWHTLWKCPILWQSLHFYILIWIFLSKLVIQFSTSHTLSFHPWGFSKLMTRIR